MARIDSAYDYYISTYAQKKVSRYDSHKKSDLRKVYNQIVKSNKDSPLYKIPNMEAAKRYAIDIKESAKSIQNVVASLSDRYGAFEDSFQKKVAVSSDDAEVGVAYIGDGSENNNAENFSISVKELATPQTNIGNYLKDTYHSLSAGSYSFDLNTGSGSYEFQYNVSLKENNRDILTKFAGLVNSSNLGITAELRSDGNGSSALALTSLQTGLSENETSLFTIAPNASAASIEAMDVLGINQITEPAHNSSFTINGAEHSSYSNTFSINNAFELTLKKPSTEPVTIGFKPNTDAIADNIQTLVDAYNSILSTAHSLSDSNVSAGNHLFNDMVSVSRSQQGSLQYIGLMSSEDGTLHIDKDILAQAVTPERAPQTFETLSKFRDSIGHKAESVAINPMNYVNKVVVAYKNPGHNFATPYISSIYSGMMLDEYM